MPFTTRDATISPKLTPIFPRLKINLRYGYDTSEKVAIYAAPYLLDNGAKMKRNLEGGIAIAIENDGVLWATFDAC